MIKRLQNFTNGYPFSVKIFRDEANGLNMKHTIPYAATHFVMQSA